MALGGLTGLAAAGGVVAVMFDKAGQLMEAFGSILEAFMEPLSMVMGFVVDLMRAFMPVVVAVAKLTAALVALAGALVMNDAVMGLMNLLVQLAVKFAEVITRIVNTITEALRALGIEAKKPTGHRATAISEAHFMGADQLAKTTYAAAYQTGPTVADTVSAINTTLGGIAGDVKKIVDAIPSKRQVRDRVGGVLKGMAVGGMAGVAGMAFGGLAGAAGYFDRKEGGAIGGGLAAGGK
jgi:hypothetical protein